jgi:hypothetical protein
MKEEVVVAYLKVPTELTDENVRYLKENKASASRMLHGHFSLALICLIFVSTLA